MPATEALDLSLLREMTSDIALWRQLRWVASTGSTNADLAGEARAGAAEGIVLISEEQTAGRGRFERRWESPAGACLAFSLLLRPRRAAADWGWLSLMTGMAVATGIEQASGAAPGRVELKWPNDVLIDGAKVCGILSERVEAQPGGTQPQRSAAIIGVGVNISLERDELPVPTATSLRLAGLSEDKTAVMAAVLREFARLHEVWERQGELHDEYQRRCASIEAPLRVIVDEHETVLGTGEAVDEYGRLVVRTPQGLRAFSAGDVFHLRLQD